MSHEITERADGTAEAAFAMQPAWHGLGAVLDHPMLSGEALTAAQLDWRVTQWPVAVGRPKTVRTPEGPVEGHDWQVQTDLANVREDTGLLLGYVTRHYKLVQNAEAFRFLDGLIDSREMEYESAFSLRGGRKVVLLGRLPRVDEIVQDDPVKRYVLLSLSHDGTAAIRFGPVAARVVCTNTYAMALGEGSVESLHVSHTGNVMGKLARARNILGLAGIRFDRYVAVGRELARRRLTGEEWERYLRTMCPVLEWDDPDWTEQRAKALDRTRQAVRECWQNPRQNLPGIEHSAWAAYCAVAEHIDHLPRRGGDWRQKAEARFNVTLYGVGRNMKQRALEAACRVAGVQTAV